MLQHIRAKGAQREDLERAATDEAGCKRICKGFVLCRGKERWEGGWDGEVCEEIIKRQEQWQRAKRKQKKKVKLRFVGKSAIGNRQLAKCSRQKDCGLRTVDLRLQTLG
jgi:hypothetical protein